VISDGKSSYKFHTIYFVLDVSTSMCPSEDELESRRRNERPERRAPYEAFRDLLPTLIEEMRDRTHVRTSCFLSIIAFASHAETVLEAASLKQFPSVPALPSGGQTNYAAAFELLGKRIPIDSATVVSQVEGMIDPSVRVAISPLVFFITDGLPYVESAAQPVREWMTPRDAIVDECRANIVTFGLGGADESVLAMLATGHSGKVNGFIADGELPAFELAEKIVGAIVYSAAQTAKTGTTIIKTPTGMRRVVKP
jgi:uncharacterized protein YegL